MNTRHQFCAVLVLSLISQSIMAAWSLEPSYLLRYERNDNIYLATENNELAVKGGTFSPAIKAIMEEEDQSLVTDVDLQFTRYSGEPELDRDEGKASLDWRTFSELSLFNLNLSYTRLSSLNTYLDTSGIVDQPVDQKTLTVNPYWRYQFAELWRIEFALSYRNVEYNESGVGDFINYEVINFVDYSERSAFVTVAHNLTEQDDLSMSMKRINYSGSIDDVNVLKANGFVCSDFFTCLSRGYFVDSIFQASEIQQNDTDYSVLQLGYEHRFETNSILSLSAGSSVTKTEEKTLAHWFDSAGDEILPNPNTLESNEPEQKSSVFDVSYVLRSEITRLEINANRSRVSASTGGLDEVDAAKILYYNNITERLSWTIDVNGEKRSPAQNPNAPVVSDYKRVYAVPSISYKLDKDWSMTLGYRYTYKDIETEQSPRESNAVFFTMSWREPKLLSTN